MSLTQARPIRAFYMNKNGDILHTRRYLRISNALARGVKAVFLEPGVVKVRIEHADFGFFIAELLASKQKIEITWMTGHNSLY